jgi:hypothetical protein
MKEFENPLRNIATDKEMAKGMSECFGNMAKLVGKAQECLNKVPEDLFDSTLEKGGERAREYMAGLVHDGTINEDYLEKVHKLRMTFPSDATRGWEEIVNAFYEEHKGKKGK